MSLFAAFKSMLGGGNANTSANANPHTRETYRGFEILVFPLKSGSQYRVNGLIRKDGQEHAFVRADTLGSADDCAQETLRKAQIFIEQVGDGMFKD